MSEGMRWASPRVEDLQGEEMRTPDDVASMLRLKELGWGPKRIGRELGCSRNTVRRYLRCGGWPEYRQPARAKRLGELGDWLAERFWRHRGNADVIRQELAQEHGIAVSLRTVERAVRPLRRELEAEARATVRFETAPGQQLQIDFGERAVSIGGGKVRVYLFVATLGYSRRLYVQAFRHERQSAWFDGIEGAFRRFGGVTREVLLDNARALVLQHDAVTREVQFTERLHAFARYWGFKPRACAPYRARTKGKDERAVGYVKRNAIAGRDFPSWAALEAHLEAWTREVADGRRHGTTGEPPLQRFAEAEAAALRPLQGRPPFRQMRELLRRVQADCSIELDSNSYSVPWRLVGERVEVVASDGWVRIRHAGREVAAHPESTGRRQRILEPVHFAGLAGGPALSPPPTAPAGSPASEPALLRPLAEYEQLLGGGWR